MPLQPSDIRLREECSLVTTKELATKEFQETIETLLDFVYGKNNKGEKRDENKPMTVGLSANQVGIMKQISIVDLAIGNNAIHDIHVLINPHIIWHNKRYAEKREGCVNLPQIWAKVKRYSHIKVEALDRSGNIITIEAKRWPAILLQHEIDHLQGFLFIDHIEDPKKLIL